MKAMGLSIDDRLLPRAEYWLQMEEEQERLYYFTLFDKILEHVSWISENSELSTAVQACVRMHT